MSLEDLARALSAEARPGTDPELAKKLGLRAADATRGALLAEVDGRSHLAVELLGCWVVDDTDLFGKGEIYWWSIATTLDRRGESSWSALTGLPRGAAPEKVGSRSWMSEPSLGKRALVGVVPPGDDVAELVVRLGFWDDDGKPADVPAALAAGLAKLADLPRTAPGGAARVIGPVRQAIFDALNAKQDDVLLDQDVTLAASDHFGAGWIGSSISANARVYYVVRDVKKTHAFGPVLLERGQIESVKFGVPMRRGGKLALFARGAAVQGRACGELGIDKPFANVILDHATEQEVASGLQVTASGAAELVAFYTAP